MNNTIIKRKLAKLFFAIIFVLSDQLSKSYLIANLNEKKQIMGNAFAFDPSYNKGIAFGILINPRLLIIVNIILLIILAHYFGKNIKEDLLLSILSWSLIFGGALGNLIDRILRSQVFDFISIYRYPIFNLADIYIFVGIMLILLFYPRIKSNE